MHMRRVFPALILGLVAFVVSIVPAFGQDSPAYLRLANYVSDGPAIDLYLNGTRSDVNTVLYGAPSDWVAVPSGESEIILAPAGGDKTDVLVPPKTVELKPGSWTTVFVSGAALRNELARSIVTEDYSNIPEGQSRITVFHGIAGAVPVNFYANGAVQIKSLIYPGSAGDNDGADTIDLPAGNYADVQILRADNGQKLLELPMTAFESGKHYLIGAMGLPEAKIAIGLQITDPKAVVEALSAPKAEPIVLEDGFLRVAHFVENGDPVDVYVDGQLSEIANLSFSNASDWVKVVPGVHQIVLTAAGDKIDNPLYGPISASIPAGTWATFYATQIQGQDIKVHALLDDYANVAPGKASLAVIHAGNPSIVINFYLGHDVLLLQGLAYPGAVGDNDGSASVDVAARAYDASVNNTNDDHALLVDLPDTEFKEGFSYLVVAYRGSDGLTAAKVFETDVKAVIGE